MTLNSSRTPAQIYQEEFVPLLFAPWTGELLERASPRQAEAILDVACGTGVVTRDAAAFVQGQSRVVGLDINPAMLDVARQVDSPFTKLIEWRQGSADALPFDARSFGVVLCQQGIQFFPDRPKAVREMARVLKPGGRAVISAWSRVEDSAFYQFLNEEAVRLFGIAMFSAPFSFSSAEALGDVVRGAGFGDVRVERITRTHTYPNPDGVLALHVAASAAVLPEMRGRTPEEMAAILATFEREVRPALERFVVDGQVVIDGTANVAVGIR